MMSKAVMLTAGLVMATVVRAEENATDGNATTGSECKRLYDEGEAACDHISSAEACDAAGECQQLITQAMTECKDDDKYFDHMENKTKYYKEEIGMMTVMCSSDCFKAVLDASSMGCFPNEDGSQSETCGEACTEKLMFMQNCSEEIPGADGGDGNAMTIGDMSRGSTTMCSPCYQMFMELQGMECFENANCDKCAGTVNGALQACEADTTGMAAPVLSSINSIKNMCDFFSAPSPFSAGPAPKPGPPAGWSPMPSPTPSSTCMSVKIPSSIAQMYKVRQCV